MKIRYNRIVLSIIAAAVLGAVAFQGLHAQTKPPVYVVNEIDVTQLGRFPEICRCASAVQFRSTAAVTSFEAERSSRHLMGSRRNGSRSMFSIMMTLCRRGATIRLPKSYSQLEVNTASSVHSPSKVSQNSPEHDHETIGLGLGVAGAVARTRPILC